MNSNGRTAKARFTVFSLVAFILFTAQVFTCSGTAHAQDPPENEVEITCPEGYKCVPDDVAQKWKKVLEHQQCMDDALDGLNEKLSLEFDAYHVVITKEGQVFDKEDMTATLTWCDYVVEFKAKPNLAVSMRDETDEKTWGFRLRVRLGANVWPRAFWPSSDASIVDPVLMFEPFFVKKFHLSTYAGLDSFGLTVGMDLTKNLDVYTGIGARWKNAELGPVVGLSLSFN